MVLIRPRRDGLQFRRVFLFLCLVAFTSARPHPQIIQKRDIFSSIANFFDNVEMQVNMDIFQPIENFFVSSAEAVANFVTMTADDFFMKAQSIVVAATYTIDMLVADIGVAIESEVIDEIMSVENFAVKIAKDVTADAETVINSVSNEFTNVIGPSLSNVGQEIGSALNVAGADILTGLEDAGKYIEAHPELIAEAFLTVAIGLVSVVQPELIGADAALIGDIAAESAAETATEVAVDIGTDAAEGAADTVVSDAADSVVEATDESLFKTIQDGFESFQKDYENVEKILDYSSKLNETLVDVAPFLPVGQRTINMLETIIAPYNEAIGMTVEVYGDFGKVIKALGAAGKIVEIFVERDVAALEPRKKPTHTSSKTAQSTPSPVSPTTLATVTTSTQMSGTLDINASATSSSTSSATGASATSTSTFIPQNIPEMQLSQWVQHHWLNRTTGGKNYTVNILKSYLKSQLQSSNITSTSLKSMVPNVLQSMGMTNITYPPTADAHRQAISHQIATGNALAYNKGNMTVKIEMSANAPVDPCLGLEKLSCFGNQIGEPYCRYGCASRWYNRMNVPVEHW